jgi:hypothetical protein
MRSGDRYRRFPGGDRRAIQIPLSSSSLSYSSGSKRRRRR